MARGKKIFLAGLVALLSVPVVYVLTHRAAGEPLTAERLAEARALWAQKGPRSYALDVDVGDQHHRIEVKEGVVVAMTTDGKDVAPAARGYWSVEGMFTFLSEELSNLQRPDAAFGVSDPGEVTLRAEFDARCGYPARFLRHVQGQTRSIEWDARLTAR